MSFNEIDESASRATEKVVGFIVLIVSGLFFLLLLFALYKTYQKNNIGFTIIALNLIVGLISFSLAVIATRLITGRGRKKTKYLLSNTSILFWGTIFGVTGVIEVILSIFYKESTSEIWGVDNEIVFLLGVVTIILGLSAYKLVRLRKKNEL